MAELSSLVFATDTTELERASRAIASLVQDMSQISVASANMARISAQTEQILARAATESAKARKENAKAADIEIKTVIAADKADAARAESIRKAAEAERRRTEATEESTRATRSNVDILQRQNDIYEFLAAGFSKGQAGILATAKATGQLSDELKRVLEAQKQFTSDSFDQSETGLKRLLKTTKEVTDAQRYFNEGANLTTKQARELSNDLDRLNASLAAQGKSYQEVIRAQAIYKQQFLDEAAVVNRANAALDAITKQRREVVSATDYMTTAEQKMTAALNTSNAAIDRSGTDLLVKYEAALRKSGVAQDVATQKLATYKVQLAQVQAQEDKRRADHLTRALPAQATDIVVSLWSGQNPLTVLLQQGGQINDMFMQSGVAAEDFAKVTRASLASMLPAMKTVAVGIYDTVVGVFKDASQGVLDFIGTVTGIEDAIETAKRWMASFGEAGFSWIGRIQALGAIAVGVFAAGMIAVTAALVGYVVGLKQVIVEEDKLALSLASSGGSLNLSHAAAVEYAKGMKGVGATTGEAIDVITAMAAAGNFLSKEIKMVVVSATEMEKYAGVAVEDTVKQFSKLKEKPVEAILELAKTSGMIAPKVVKAVIELERQGKAADAVALAMTTLADVNKEKVNRMKEDFSSLSLAIISLKDNFSSLFAGIFKSMFYKDNPITELRKQIAEQEEQNIKTVATKGADYFRLPEMEAHLNGLREQLATTLKTNLAREQGTAANVAGAKAEEETEKLRAKHQGVIAKAKAEIIRLDQLRADWLKKNVLTEERSLLIATGIREENKKIADELKKDAPKGDKKLDSFYDASMTKFRDASIAATDATKELTKSQIELMQTVADPKFAKLSEQKKLDILQSGAAAIAKEQEKEATIALVKAEEFREKVLGKSEGLGKQYYADIEALYKHAKATKWSTEQIDEMIVKIYKGTPVYQAYQKTIDRVTEALHKFSEASIAYQSSTNAENQELDYRISLLGRTTEEQRKLQIEYQRETKINTVRIELEKKLRDIAKERAKAEKDGVVGDKIKELTDAEVQARQDAAERIKVINKGVAVEYASDLDKEVAAVKRGISDSIVTALFEGGEEGSKQLRKVLVDTLRKKVTIVVDAVVNTLVGNIAGKAADNVVGNVAGGVAGKAGSGILGSFAASSVGLALKGWGTAFGESAIASISGSSFSAAVTKGVVEGAIAGAEYPGASFAANIGAATPYIAAALVIANGLGLFRETSQVGGGLSGKLGEGDINKYALMRKDGTLFGGPDYSLENKGVSEGSKAIQSAYEAIRAGTGDLVDSLGLSSEALRKFTTTLGTDILHPDTGGIGIKLEGLTAEQANAKVSEALKAASNTLAQQVIGTWEQILDVTKYTEDELAQMNVRVDESGVSWKYQASEYARFGESAIDTLTRLGGALSTINGAFDMLGVTLLDKTLAGASKASTIADSFGGIDKASNALGAYYDAYYTDAEKTANATRLLHNEFTKLGQGYPESTTALRKLIEAQDLNTASGRDMYAALVKLAPTYKEVQAAVEELTSASKRLVGVNKILSSFNLKTTFKYVDFTKATKDIFESFGVAVEDYSNSISGVLDGILTGKVKAEDAGKSLAEAAVGGITSAIAKAGTDAIAAQFVMSVITPILDNIRSGKAALDGVDVQGGVAKAKQDAVDLKIVLNTLGIDIGNGLIGFADGIVSAGNTAQGMIARTSKFAIGGSAAGSTTVIYSSGVVNAGSSNVGTNQYGGVGDSHFAIGGSAVNNMYRSPEAQSLTELTNQTLSSNLKVSELLQKLLNPEKLFENKYKALDDQLIQQRKELSRTNVGGGLGVNESTLQADIDALRNKIADNTSVHAIIDPMISALEHIVYNPATDGLKAADSIFGDLAKLIVERSEGTPSSLGGYSIKGNAGDPIQTRIQDTLKESFSSAIGEDKLDWWVTEFINDALGVTSASDNFFDNLDLQTKITQMAELETKLREWYTAQARVIAVEDMSALATETIAAKAKTAELKRTGGLEDPVSKLKEQLAQKMQAIDEGIGKALLAEVDVLKGQKTDTSKIEALLSMQTGRRDILTADGYLSDRTALLSSEISSFDSGRVLLAQQASDLQKAWRDSVGTDNEAYAASAYSNHIATLQYLEGQRMGFENELNRLNNGGLTDDINAINAAITKTEEELTAAILAATDPAKQEALLAEIAKYKGGITEWYKAQADLLSTEMLVDINKQIKELETSEKGPLTTIKDAIQKYIDDFKALGTLTDDIQTQIDKLSGLQLTKARKSLYDQLLSPEELKTRDTLALTSEFSKLGKVIPDSTSSLRAMIDAANAAGNTTLADKLLELVPAFLAVQDAVDGTNDALSKAKTATDEAYAALERAVEAQRTILTESINKLKAVFDAAKNAAKTLYSEVDSVRKQSADAGNAFIDQALQDLKNSGVIPDGVKLQDAIDSSMKGLSSEVYDSAFEEQRGRLILAGKLTTIADLTEPQLTLAEKQLKDLDAILETARAQIDELRGINTSVLSVATAISNLAAAIAAEKATVVQPVVHQTGGVNPPPWQPPSTGGGGGDAAIVDLSWKPPPGTPGYTNGVRNDYSPGGGSSWMVDYIENSSKLPGFDVGINNIPYDMPAYLHAGESVIPSEFNPFNPSASTPLSLTPIGTSGVNQTQDNSDIIEENRLLRQELQAQNGAMVRLLSKVARVVERWDGDGLPEPRTETA